MHTDLQMGLHPLWPLMMLARNMKWKNPFSPWEHRRGPPMCPLASSQYNTIQYNTIQYNTIQYNTIQYNTIQYNTIQYNTIQYNTIQYNTIQYNTIQYNTIQYNTIQYNTIQYNTIQYNTIQYNTIQYNTIQYNTIQYNTIQYSTILKIYPFSHAFDCGTNTLHCSAQSSSLPCSTEMFDSRRRETSGDKTNNLSKDIYTLKEVTDAQPAAVRYCTTGTPSLF